MSVTMLPITAGHLHVIANIATPEVECKTTKAWSVKL